MTNSSTSLGERIRLALLDLSSKFLRGEPHGVSQSEIARAVGVSEQRVSFVLHGNAPFPFDWLPRLPERAWIVALAEMHAARGASVKPVAVKRCAMGLMSQAGDLTHSAAWMLVDDEIDAHERKLLRPMVASVRASCDTLTRAIDDADAAEALNAGAH